MNDKKNLDKILQNLISLYNKGQFGSIISVVDSELEFDELDLLSKKIYIFSLIRTGNTTESQYLIEKLLETTPEDPELLNAMGYIHLMKGNRTASLNYLLDAEYYSTGETKNKIKNNIQLFSEVSDTNTLKSIVKPKDFLILSLPKEVKKLSFPKLPQINNNVILVGFGTVSIIVVGYFLISYIPNVSKNNRDIISENISKIEIETTTKLIEPKPILTNEITLTEKEISSIFSEIRTLLSKNRSSNKARFLANYLLHSNASTQIKSKVEVLKTFMEEPEINLDWQPLYEEVNSKPIIYDSVYVVWKGKVVNLSKTSEGIEFTLLIQGKDESVIKGFIRAKARSFLEGYVGQTVTILGKISSSKDMFLEVKKVIE
ncbi:MAG: hypothetical protein N2712_06555 [Brevinematales bacterium]|nr:hypothetical protein [Brevinematales bacterium]